LKTPITAPQDAEQDEIDLGALAIILWAGKWRIAFTSTAALAVGVAWLLNTPPTFQANALIQIEDKAPSLALPDGLADLMSSGGGASNAELQLLHSRLTLGTAVAKAHLDWVASPTPAPLVGYAVAGHGLPLPDFGPLARFARPGDAITLDYLKVPPAWLDEVMDLTNDGQSAYTITLPDGDVLQGQVGQLLTNAAKDFGVSVASLTGAAGRTYTLGQVSELRAIGSLDTNLAEAEQGKGSGVVEVTLKGPNPDLARRTLDAIINAFHEQNLARSSAEAQKSLEFVESQIPDVEANLKAAEAALNDYKARQRSVDISFETQSLLSQTQATEEKLRELAQSEEDIKRKYAPDHPIYRQLLDNRRALQGRLDELNGQIGTLPETQKQVLNMTRDLAAAQAADDALKQRAQELSVLKASTIGNVRIVDPAATPTLPIAPKKGLILALSLLLGAVLGSALVLVREKLRRGIEGVDEIEALGVPVFATISLMENSRKGKGDLDASRTDVVSRDQPASILVEEFKSLRTSLHFGMLDAKNQSLAITSGAPDAGKSFVSANIAAVSAASGLRVCLIDADMRRGRQRLRFGLKRSTVGLSEYLSEDMRLEDVLHGTDISGLTFLNTGKFPPNPSELLTRPKFRDLIEELTQRFELVVIDCPPILAVTDAAVVGRIAGATFVVARHQKTEIGELAASMRALEAAGVSIKGAILNAFDRRNLKHYGNYGYKYKYSYSYGYKTIEDEPERKA
jgi:tyrosine-protein kinase Etk/Wzc